MIHEGAQECVGIHGNGLEAVCELACTLAKRGALAWTLEAVTEVEPKGFKFPGMHARKAVSSSDQSFMFGEERREQLMYTPGSELPKTRSELWAELEEQFSSFEEAYRFLRLQTKEQTRHRDNAALMDEEEAGSLRSFIIKFRKTDYQPNIEFFWALFFESFPGLKKDFKKKAFTPKFISLWWRVSMAYGYLMNSAFALGGDFFHVHAGREKERRDRKRWVSLIITNAMKKGIAREKAQGLIFTAIMDLISEGKFSKEFDRSWYESLINEDLGCLKATYTKPKLRRKDMDELIKDKTITVPPLLDLGVRKQLR